MSSVAGSRSLHVGSEETFDYVCEPCKYRGIEKEGTSYCEKCQEKLCQNCTDAHKGQKISRNHALIPISKLQSEAVTKQGATCIVLCECNQNSGVVVHCQDHDDVICQSCVITKHRACKTVSIGERCASYPKEKFAAVTLKATNLNDETDQILNERKSYLKSYLTMAEKAKEEIEKYRQDINQQIDMMEQAILTEVDDKRSRNQQKVDSHISTYTTTKQLIQTDLKILNDVKKTADKAEMFAADVKVSKRLAEYECLLRDIHREAKSPRLMFKENDQMLVNIKNIGTLLDHTAETDRKEKSLFTDLKVASVSQKNVKISTDRKTPSISGCVVLPDGLAVLCDYNNRNLKLFDKFFTLQDSLELPCSPWDISVVNDTTVLITLQDKKQLQYIEVAPKLKLARSLQLDKMCWGVHVDDSDIYVSCHCGYPGGDGEVKIVDNDGVLRNRLGVNQDITFMFKTPFYLTVNNRSTKIYVSDFIKNTLTCLKSNGTIMFQYKDPELLLSRGMCVDDEDNVILCCERSNNIHLVTNDGKKHSVILTAKDGIKSPCSVAYKQTDRTLIVGCLNNDNVYVLTCSCVGK